MLRKEIFLNRKTRRKKLEDNKLIYLIIGPSGSGKTTLGNFLKENGVPELISHTTRKMRKGEIDGETYYYVTKEEFDKIDKIEVSNYGGNHYCLSRKEVEEKLRKYDKVFAIVDVNGVKQIKKHYDNVVVVYIDVTMEEMTERMKQRGDKEENIIKRLKYAIDTKEFSNKKYADIIIRNDSLERAKEALKNVVMVEDNTKKAM